MNLLRSLLILAALAYAGPALAALPTIFVDTGGSATNSGTTDSNTATATGTAGSWTTGTNTITLDNNTNLTGVATDGSQAIYLNNATNTNGTAYNIFFIVGITGCTGSGSCSVTTSGSPAAPTCSTCTGSSWAVGGRYVWPSGSGVNVIEGGLVSGVTIQFNQTPATKTVSYTTAQVSGAANGTITLQGKSGVSGITLEVTSGGSAVISGNSKSNWVIKNLTLKQDGTGNDVSNFSGAVFYVGDKFIASGASCLTGANIMTLINSEISQCTGATSDGLNGSGGIYMYGSYVHGAGRDGIRASSASGSNQLTIAFSVIANNAGRGLFFSGNSYAAQVINQIYNSSFVNNTGVNLEATSADQGLVILNSLFYNTNNSANNNLQWDSGSNDVLLPTSAHGNNVFFSPGTPTCTGGGPGCVSGMTLNATELTTDPIISSTSGPYTVGSAGSAAQAGFPGVLPGTAGTGYLDIGALQIQSTAGGGSQIIGGGM